jgi:hypothetical protein
MLNDEVLAVMANHELTTARTGVLVNKLVVAGRHVHCMHLDDKRIDAHDELGEHGDERTVLSGVIKTYNPDFKYDTA